jgi:hypothetical protein
MLFQNYELQEENMVWQHFAHPHSLHIHMSFVENIDKQTSRTWWKKARSQKSVSCIAYAQTQRKISFIARRP